MDKARLTQFIDHLWDEAVVPTLVDYIRIPNKSPSFDKDWAAHGYMAQAVALFETWAREKIAAIPGAELEVVQLPNRTPLIFVELPGQSDDTVLLYGHLDKQPEMKGWADGTGPWTPVIKDDKLFGRGGADDGYAMFAALSALLALAEQETPRARAVILIEACEESGSYDLPAYVDHLTPRIGEPSLVVCLDSGCGDYERLWLTTSLRGVSGGVLSIRVLDEGVHSGSASGIVPSSFRILRELLSRLEDENTGAIVPKELYVEVPAQRTEQAKRAAQILGSHVYDEFPFAKGVSPVSRDLSELILNRTWRPQLAVTGMDGLPQPPNAGNVMLPDTVAKVSVRLPPTLPAAKVDPILKALFESKAPYGAQVSFRNETAMTGWDAPPLAPWLETAVESASRATFGAEPAYMGEGGSIPFMAMLGEKFPKTQFVVTGVLGPHSNAHGPNEFLHIPTGKRVSACVAMIIAAHFEKGKR
ncbi:MAG TPA: M20 family metallopeptidase [Rhizomicrobium sp.]|nr:M20 family metallopeptidase [Rhizomicrobium sp.]